MGKTTKYTERRFLGKLPENPTAEDKKLHKKHLKSYLRGDTQYVTGWIKNEGGLPPRFPQYSPVAQEVTENEELKKLLTGK